MIQRRLALKCGPSLLFSKGFLFFAALAWIGVFQTWRTISTRQRELESFSRGDPEGRLLLDERVMRPTPVDDTEEGGAKGGVKSGGGGGGWGNFDRDAMQGDGGFYYPGRPWFDTDGKLIQAHGGGILYDEISGYYYWYGENKDGPTYTLDNSLARVDLIGVNAYKSRDLVSWANVGIVLAPETANRSSDLYFRNVLERPKVLFNKRTKQYVMWAHVDSADYKVASVGVATSGSPEGPFEYLGKFRPWGGESRDFTVFQDPDDGDGAAFLVCSSEMNSELHIGRLTDDYLSVGRHFVRRMVGRDREAPAVFKHRQLFYMVTSGCTGWDPNSALIHVASSMTGRWKLLGDPCTGGDRKFRQKTFLSQGTFVLPLPGLPRKFVFMADRWFSRNLRNSRYVWLPLSVEVKGSGIERDNALGIGHEARVRGGSESERGGKDDSRGVNYRMDLRDEVEGTRGNYASSRNTRSRVLVTIKWHMKWKLQERWNTTASHDELGGT
eukprot:jgi/Mesen1/8153/ME000438S07257